MATKDGVVAFMAWDCQTPGPGSLGERFNTSRDYFICNTEQPGFIPNMPTVNNKTDLDKLNITENTILYIKKNLTLLNHLVLTK